MAIYRYFFWIEDNELEVYKNGKIVLYKGERKVDYSQGIDSFFELWKENSAYIPEALTDFIFIGKKKENLEKFTEYCEKFPFDTSKQFTFENLKSVIDDKNLKKFCIEVGDKQYFLQKTEYNYNRIPRDIDLEKIYVYGKNIKENLLSEDNSDMEIQTKNINETESDMASFFRSRLGD